MKLRCFSNAVLASLVLASSAAAGPLDFLFGTPNLELQWRHFGTVSEIASYDATTKKVFTTNSADGTVDVLDATDGTLLHQINVGDVNSVECYEGLVAIAVDSGTVGVRGKVMLVDAEDYSVFAEPEVGFLPDMVTFTPNGKYVLVANEGEPEDDYILDPVGSVSIIDVTNPADPEVFEAGFESFNSEEAELKAAGVRIFGPGSSVAQDMEPEYITVSANSRTAYVSCQENNAVAVINIPAKRIVSINPLGYKDHSLAENALDVSDRDDAINIQPWPVKGMYMPDSIAATQYLGFTLVASANEGDAREYGDYAEEERVKDLVLDPSIFPDAEDLHENETLGRLTVTTTMGDIDNDGDFDELYSFGARSFSIWLFTPFGQTVQVFDSGSEFEEIIAAQVPEEFNSNEGEADSFDNRSDNKGPEPEALDIGSDLGCTWTFIGLERVGGIMLYDISNPLNPSFVQYERDSVDSAPEGINFIPRGEGPFSEPSIVVANEVSGTTTFYRIKRTGGLLSSLLND